MKETTVTDRLTFLAEQFDVFEYDGVAATYEAKIAELKEKNELIAPIFSPDGKLLALVSEKKNEKGRTLKKISVVSDVFANMIAADPTENRMYIQWMLNTFSRLIKAGDEHSIDSAIRFVHEDLPQANVYLILFEDNKRKRKFKELCESSYSLKHVSDPTNINQYKSLSQLFDAVDPFIEREPSAVERTMNKFVDSGHL